MLAIPVQYSDWCWKYNLDLMVKDSVRSMATRTTRMPAFWDPPHAWLPTLGIHIRSQVKPRQSQNYKFKRIAKNSNFEISQETLHGTHLDKMCKYEMDPTRTVGFTEWTQDAGQMDQQTDRQTDWWRDRRMDGQSETNIPPTNNFVVRGV